MTGSTEPTEEECDWPSDEEEEEEAMGDEAKLSVRPYATRVLLMFISSELRYCFQILTFILLVGEFRFLKVGFHQTRNYETIF